MFPRAAALILALGLALPAAAQRDMQSVLQDSTQQPTRPQLPQEPQPIPQTAVPLLDVPIDRQQYALGAGDVLALAVLGDLNQVFTVVVNPEGSLIIPGIGIARVLGVNLDVAESRVRALVTRLYRNVDVHLSLSQVRSFKVFVVGDVAAPGVRVATAATRVSEVVQGAARPDTLDAVRRRNVQLRRTGGEVVDVDLARFRQMGDLQANPYLREGDAVVIPAIDERVQLRGRFHFPGEYEYRRGDTLARLIELANGGAGFPTDAADTVYVVRFAADGRRTTHAFTRQEVMFGEPAALPVQPFDAIYVAGSVNYRRQSSVTVRGQVAHPGRYPIRTDTTTVRDVIAMAGGFAPEASLSHATLRRDRSAGAELAVEELTRLPPDLLTPAERQILQIYSREQAATNVVIDFRQLFLAGVDLYDYTLRDGDLLDVPMRRPEVTVMGAVAQPGMVQHIPGMPITQAVGLAGGYSRRANPGRITVLRSSVGTRLDRRDVRVLEEGDVVIVPYREDRDWVRIIQTASGVVTTIAGVVFTTRALFGL